MDSGGRVRIVYKWSCAGQLTQLALIRGRRDERQRKCIEIYCTDFIISGHGSGRVYHLALELAATMVGRVGAFGGAQLLAGSSADTQANANRHRHRQAAVAAAA